MPKLSAATHRKLRNVKHRVTKKMAKQAKK